MSIDLSAIRSRLLGTMHERGMCRRRLSERAGLSESAVRGFLTRTDNPGIVNLDKICDALDLPLIEVINS